VPGDRSAADLNLIVPVGTQIVLRTDIYVHDSQSEYPRGSVAEITRTPDDGRHSYRAKMPDGAEFSVRRQEFSVLKQVKTGPLGDAAHVLAEYDLYKNVIYRCVVGSQAPLTVFIIGVFTAIAVAGSPRHYLHNGRAFPGEQKPVLIFEALQPAPRYVVLDSRRGRPLVVFLESLLACRSLSAANSVDVLDERGHPSLAR
jgi:hypothetical protein